jgi:hypothetical protein
VLDLAIQIANELEAARKKRIIHRDIRLGKHFREQPRASEDPWFCFGGYRELAIFHASSRLGSKSSNAFSSNEIPASLDIAISRRIFVAPEQGPLIPRFSLMLAAFFGRFGVI